MDSLPAHKLPAIDFTKANLKPGTDVWLSTSKKVVDALQEYGCFLAEYDDVPLQIHNDVFLAVEEVFDLPLETKRRSVPNPLGYLGKQESFPDLYEATGINDTTLEGIQDFTTPLWPQGNDTFCKKVYSYTKLVAEWEQKIMRMVFEIYGLDSFETTKQEVTQYLLAMSKYREPKMDEDRLGCHIHTDKGFLTILDQNHVNGLEVKTKDGHWIGIDMSRPSSFLVMAGEALLAWSNGRIHAPFHRVMMNEGETRYSTALFSYAKGIVKVPEKLIDDDHPLKFKPFDNFGLIRYYFTPDGMVQESTVAAYCGV